MKILRIVLAVLILLGVGLLVTHAYWLPNVTSLIAGQGTSIQSEPVSTTTPPVTTLPPSQPKPPVATTTPPNVSSGIDITVTIGPTCPVQQYPEQPQCADKPYETTLVLASTIIGKNGGVLIKTDSQGHYSQNLSPGTYTIRAQSTNTPPTLQPATFVVKENTRTALKLQFDSGIR